MQTELKQKLGIIVDVPRQGSGTSNDGNTARTFFKNPQIVAEATKVDEMVIRKCSILLQVLTSGRAIDENKFETFAISLAELFVEKYGWYYMPSSVHKVLLHGSDIIKSACLPIGQLSEEASESRNKDFKRFRQLYSRKCSRSATNEDILHSLLISSDPYLTSLRKKWKKNVGPELDVEAIQLLAL